MEKHLIKSLEELEFRDVNSGEFSRRFDDWELDLNGDVILHRIILNPIVGSGEDVFNCFEDLSGRMKIGVKYGDWVFYNPNRPDAVKLKRIEKAAKEGKAESIILASQKVIRNGRRYKPRLFCNKLGSLYVGNFMLSVEDSRAGYVASVADRREFVLNA